MMFKKSLLLAFLGCLFYSVTFAQQTWTLQECIEHAKEHSLTLKQAEYGIKDSELLEKMAKSNRLPGVSGGATFGYNFGRTINPVTNDFENETIGFNSFRIDASVTLYDGGRTTNSIKQSKINTKAAELDAEATFNFIALSIANSYLMILNAEEQLGNAKKRAELSKEQLDRTDKLIAAGTLPKNDRLDVLAQMARDDQAIIQAKNAIELNYLNLKQLLEVDPNTEISIEKPQVVVPSDAQPGTVTFREVYASALSTQPEIKADELRLESADLNVNISRSGMLPSLILFGGLDTRWSSLAKDFANPNTENQTTVLGDPIPVVLNNDLANVQFFSTEGITYPEMAYFDQLDQNFGQNVGLSLNIPIYTRGQNKINMDRAQLGVLNARVQSEQTRNTLKTNVQDALASARAAKLSLDATQRTLEAAEAAYNNAQKRYDLGAINTFDLTTARNNLDIAERDAVSAKYEYVFRLKVLDFYQGRPLKLD